MQITHVMRGEEWLTNTNKHIYLYKILGAPVPQFIHLPLIKDMTGKKLAKRDPLSSIEFLKQNQYQLDAVKSFLAQLGMNRTTS
jgi:glutamyl/glutaminyl-tRNA synthetase